MNPSDSKTLEGIEADLAQCKEEKTAISMECITGNIEIVDLRSKVKEQDREIDRLREKGMWEAYDRAYKRGFVSKDRADKAEARVKELEELLGEETYAERAAVRHYKRVAEQDREIEKLIGALGKISIECSKWPNLGCSAPVCDIIRAVSAEKEKV